MLRIHVYVILLFYCKEMEKRRRNVILLYSCIVPLVNCPIIFLHITISLDLEGNVCAIRCVDSGYTVAMVQS